MDPASDMVHRGRICGGRVVHRRKIQAAAPVDQDGGGRAFFAKRVYWPRVLTAGSRRCISDNGSQHAMAVRTESFKGKDPDEAGFQVGFIESPGTSRAKGFGAGLFAE